MTTPLLIRDVLERDPTASSLQNGGVSKVSDEATLFYELSTFVCEGKYEEGLDRILDAYLTQLHLQNQVSAWVSGFYGSGKSHLAKILEAIWVNRPLPNGQLPRDVARLTDPIKDHLIQLSNEAKRAGGLWAASGMLTESGTLSVRMLILGIVYRAAGLSSDYGRARFRLWVRQRGWEDEIVRRIVAEGYDPDEEFAQYLVSPIIAQAVWELSGARAGDPDTAQSTWEAQFNRQDVSTDDMIAALREVLRLQSTDGKQVPLALIVLDEVQQYLGEDGSRSQALQEAIERIQTEFDSRVMVVATGQAALSDTANLQKLMGRFTVNVMLSDQDVERVVREVVLKKNPVHHQAVEGLIRRVEGEVDRHLQSTRIGPRSEDKAILVADYPLLPTRGRFWAHLLHRLDPTGTSGQLRTQLRVVHAATMHMADKPLGHAIPADFIFDQLQNGLQQSGALPRDVSNAIADQLEVEDDGRLRARLIQLIFLIEKLPVGELSDIGLRATPEALADLIVEDLPEGSDDLRRRVPNLLSALEEDGKLLRQPDGSYAIQTGESLKWQDRFRQERQALLSSPGSLGEIRSRTLESLIREMAKPIQPRQGASRVGRELSFRFGNDTPRIAPGDSQVIVWVRDGWNSSPATVVNDARLAGDDDPIISVFVPQRNQQELQAALANYEAARRTVDLLGASQDSPEGQQAAAGMRVRSDENLRRFTGYLREAAADASVYLGGGSEVEGTSLTDRLQSAVESSLRRLFPRFTEGDHPDWDKVYTQAAQGNTSALKAIGHQGDASDHPVVREIRRQIPGGPGVSWANLRKTFENAPYGWPRDTVDGAISVLVNFGSVNATRDGRQLRGKDLNRQQASSINLVAEDVELTITERLAARRPFLVMDGVSISKDEQVDAGVRDLVGRIAELARRAGGEPPRPLSQVPDYVVEMQNQFGKQLIKSLAANVTALDADIRRWREQEAEIDRRMEAWVRTERLARHAERLPVYPAIAERLAAIRDNRLLLETPDPVTAVAAGLANALREALAERIDLYADRLEAELAELKGSPEWVRLTDQQQEAILARPQLRPRPKPALSSDRDLLTALDQRDLAQWDAELDALAKRINDAHLEAVRMIQPQVIEVSLEKPLMEKPIDVERWIERTRETLLAHVNAGHPVKIK